MLLLHVSHECSRDGSELRPIVHSDGPPCPPNPERAVADRQLSSWPGPEAGLLVLSNQNRSQEGARGEIRLLNPAVPGEWSLLSAAGNLTLATLRVDWAEVRVETGTGGTGLVSLSPGQGWEGWFNSTRPASDFPVREHVKVDFVGAAEFRLRDGC